MAEDPIFTEKILWTPLPNGMKGDSLQLAVLVSPRLYSDPPPPEGFYADPSLIPGHKHKLGDDYFTGFMVKDWTLNVQKYLTFNVRFGNGPPGSEDPPGSIIEPVKNILEPSLWPSLFHDTTPVIGYTFPALASDRTLVHSFPAKDLITPLRDIYKTYIKKAIPKSPRETKIPTVGDLVQDADYWNNVTSPLVSVSDVMTEDFRNRVDPLTPEKPIYGDVINIRQNLTPRKSGGHGQGTQPFQQSWSMAKFLPLSRDQSAFFQFSRFYEYERDANWPRVMENPFLDFDFHKILAALGDHPLLMRRLGLVLLLNIPREAVPDNGDCWVKVEPVWDLGINNAGLTEPAFLNPRTHYTVENNHFRATDKPKETDQTEKEWLKEGWLDLRGVGDIFGRDGEDPSEVFGLVQVDMDGTALKLLNYSRILANIVLQKKVNTALMFQRKDGSTTTTTADSSQSKESAAAPALRTAGISLIRKDRNKIVNYRLRASLSLNDYLEKKSKKPHELYAEDLLRGYRVDVRDQGGPWRSLCRRQGRYIISNPGNPGIPKRTIVIPPAGEDGKVSEEEKISEGYVKSTSATSHKPNEIYVHPSLFTWNGWSLCTPHPGRPLPPDSKAPDDKPEGSLDFVGIHALFESPRASLPALRFGHTYRLRVRAVDVAGNDMTGDDTGWESGNEAYASKEITYRRFEPVSPPIVIECADMNEGESLERLVIRSSVDYKGKYEQPVVQQFTEYLKASPGLLKRIKYLPTCERIFAPPKVSQMMAEQHGMFDKPMTGLTRQFDGSDDTFRMIDKRDPVWDKSSPVSKKYKLSPRKTFIIDYLPDPVAAGVEFKNLPGALADSTAEASFTPVSFMEKESEHEWPEAQVPFRFVLQESRDPRVPDALQDIGKTGYLPKDRLLKVSLPPGQVCTVRYSCIIGNPRPGVSLPEKITPVFEKMAMWDRIKKVSSSSGSLQLSSEAVVHGQHWMLTPYRELTLVHAVQRPLKKPVIEPMYLYRDSITSKTLLAIANKEAGNTFITIAATLHVDAKSTGKVELLATWTDPIDDMTDTQSSEPKWVEHTGHVFDQTIEDPATDTVVIDGIAPNVTESASTRYRHEFGDTKHRKVSYYLRGTTRFRDYFPPELTADPHNISVDGKPYIANVLSSARPAAPKVLYVIPVFEWQTAGGLTEPFDYRMSKTRLGGGLRVYLDRPWYSSGEGEKLGVVLMQAQALTQGYTGITNETFTRFTRYLTQWGRDPVQDPVLDGPKNLFPGVGSFRNATIIKDLTLDEMQEERDSYKVSVAAYDVTFDKGRQLWYADIDVDPDTAYFPFIRLALARVQPDSVPGTHLSKVAIADFAQITPFRAAQIQTHFDQITKKFMLDIKVMGVFRTKPRENLTICFDIQKRIPGIKDEDLCWKTINSGDLVYQGGPVPWHLTEIPYPGVMGSKEYRLVIKEFELFEQYPDPPDPLIISDPVTGIQKVIPVTDPFRRLVYAVAFDL